MVALHGSQIAQFPLGVQLGVSQQHQIALCIQLTGNACRDLPHRLGTDAGSDHPHLIHFSGAQSLGGGIRAVAGLFHYLVDDSPLLFAQGASVQVAADRRTGYTRHFCNITDGHLQYFSLLGCIVMCKRFHAYYKPLSPIPQDALFPVYSERIFVFLATVYKRRLFLRSRALQTVRLRPCSMHARQAPAAGPPAER